MLRGVCVSLSHIQFTQVHCAHMAMYTTTNNNKNVFIQFTFTNSCNFLTSFFLLCRCSATSNQILLCVCVGVRVAPGLVFSMLFNSKSNNSPAHFHSKYTWLNVSRSDFMHSQQAQIHVKFCVLCCRWRALYYVSFSSFLCVLRCRQNDAKNEQRTEVLWKKRANERVIECE